MTSIPPSIRLRCDGVNGSVHQFGAVVELFNMHSFGECLLNVSQTLL